eukprot:GDKJ01048611.1.p1 GENE.GDKJ01048611.1~~GDKJ01048611.1.p1  ORF type:complete len:612 (-),score=126.15 GDKJ01048611.1:75-1910(-)
MGQCVCAVDETLSRAVNDKTMSSGVESCPASGVPLSSLTPEELAQKCPLGAMAMAIAEKRRQERDLVVSSIIKKIEGIGDYQFGMAIYRAFMGTSPQYSTLFPDNKSKEDHASAVVKSLIIVLKASTKQQHSLRRKMVDLGYRHFAEYNTPTAAYAPFGTAILKTLENSTPPEQSGGVFTPEEYELVRNTWNSVEEWLVDGSAVAESEWKQPGAGRLHQQQVIKNGANAATLPVPAADGGVPRGIDGLPLPNLPMTDEDYRNIEDIWKQVTPLGNEVIGRLLYQQMFALRADLLQLFSFRMEKDMYFSEKFKHHTSRVVRAVNNAICNVRRWNVTMIPIFEALGETHLHYKVKPEDFPLMADCICNVLRAHFKEGFTPAIEISWQKFYSKINAALSAGLNKAVTELRQRGGIEALSKSSLNNQEKTGDGENDEEEEEEEEAYSEQDLKDIQKSFDSSKKLGPETVGRLLFQKMRTLNVDLLPFFDFKNPEDVFSSPTFLNHATRVILTVGNAVVNVRRRESILRNLERLGETHVDHKVKPSYFLIMGECLVFVLEKALGGEIFKKKVKLAWSKTFRLVAGAMTRGLKNELKKRRATGDLTEEEVAYWAESL